MIKISFKIVVRTGGETGLVKHWKNVNTIGILKKIANSKISNDAKNFKTFKIIKKFKNNKIV
jgi:hypothetical protein